MLTRYSSNLELGYETHYVKEFEKEMDFGGGFWCEIWERELIWKNNFENHKIKNFPKVFSIIEKCPLYRLITCKITCN